MLGEQYLELSGKITGQRVLDIEGPTIETSVATKGTIKGVQVQEIITFTGRPTVEKGVLHGVGQGVITTTTAGSAGEEPEMVRNCHFSIIWLECLRPRLMLMETFLRNGSGNRY
jgi:hypothetical protein